MRNSIVTISVTLLVLALGAGCGDQPGSPTNVARPMQETDAARSAANYDVLHDPAVRDALKENPQYQQQIENSTLPGFKVVAAPAAPAAETPAAEKPAAETPTAEKPAAEQPAAEKPAEPAAEKPAEPAAEKPAEPAAESPAEPAAEKPAEPAAETPAEPATEGAGDQKPAENP